MRKLSLSNSHVFFSLTSNELRESLTGFVYVCASIISYTTTRTSAQYVIEIEICTKRESKIQFLLATTTTTYIVMRISKRRVETKLTSFYYYTLMLMMSRTRGARKNYKREQKVYNHDGAGKWNNARVMNDCGFLCSYLDK